MLKNMRGFIDPLTLGFIISLIGSTTVLVANSSQGTEQSPVVSQTDTIINCNVEEDYQA